MTNRHGKKNSEKRERRKNLDEFHGEQMKLFKAERESIPKLKKELQDLRMQVDGSRKTAKTESKIRRLEDKISRCEKRTDETKYFRLTGHLLFEYYDKTIGEFYNNNNSSENTADAIGVTHLSLIHI